MRELFKLERKTNTNLDWAVQYCNEVLFNSDHQDWHDFIDAVGSKDKFDMSTASPDHIAKKIILFKNSDQVMNVKLYKSRNPWSKAYGYYTPSRPFDININTRKMNRSVESFIATLTHEMIHAIDGLDMVHNYGHGDNSSVGKDNTAPYWISNQAAKLFDGNEIKAEDYPTYKRKKPSLWARFWRWLF